MIEKTLPKNTGWASELDEGQFLRVEGVTTADVVALNRDDTRERFDQARTKVVNGHIFPSVGTPLITNFNNVILTIVEDTYEEGTHDMEKGMCSRQSWDKWADVQFENYENWEKLDRQPEDLPDHGCWENLSEALEPWGIEPHEIPSPVNLYQTMDIDGETGEMEFSPIKPDPGTYVVFEARMDCIVGVSACPEGGRGKSLEVRIGETLEEVSDRDLSEE